MARADITKHKGFPGRFPGTDFQFTIRRANPKGVTPLTRRERYADRKALDKRVDEAFMAALWDYFGEEPFERGNLDAGRLSWLFGREVVAAEEPFDPVSYQALLRINVDVAQVSYPSIFGGDDDWDEEDEFDDDEDEWDEEE